MSMGEQYSCPGAHGGLWRFEDSADDILGRITNTWTNMTFDVMGRFNKFFVGNGARRATFGYTYFKPTSFTLTFWYKGTSPGSDAVVLSNITVASSKNYGFYVGFDGTTKVGVGIAYGGATIPLYAISTTTISDGLWHFVCATYDATDLKMYVDGVLEATTNKGAYGLAYNSYMYPAIGCFHTTSVSYSYHIVGSVDDLAVYAYAWTAGEVKRWWAFCNGKLV